MRIHEPVFPEHQALWIIWCKPRFGGGQYSLAAGGITAMRAAWDAIQSDNPDDILTLQAGAHVISERGPIR